MTANPSVKVEILSADHQNKPDIGVGIVRKWLDVDKVDAIADVPNSAVALAVNEILRGSHAAFVASSTATSDLTGKYCSPNTIQWTIDTWALAHTIAEHLVRNNSKKWYFIATDNALGKSLVRDASAVVIGGGGSVVGSVSVPLNSSDFSSFLLQADAADSSAIAFATAGEDLISLIEQSNELGIHKDGRNFVALLTTINDIHTAGLPLAHGLVISLPFYWDMNDATRAWTKRFSAAEHDRIPTAFQAGVYSSVLAYLNSAITVETKDGAAVIAKMKRNPIYDALFGEVVIRPDGRAIHDMYLFAAKEPQASKGSWDLLDKIGVFSGQEAFRPLDQGACMLVEAKH